MIVKSSCSLAVACFCVCYDFILNNLNFCKYLHSFLWVVVFANTELLDLAVLNVVLGVPAFQLK